MLYQEPLIKPVSNWTAPTYFPKIGNVFGFDCETKDPGLTENGPSSLRGGGYPVGVSVADEKGAYYFPFAHGGGGNMDKGFVLKWLKPILEDPNRLMVGANLLYEFEWMAFLGIDIKCQIWDVQTAESLLDEEAMSVSLNNLCVKYLGKTKNEAGLKEAAVCYGFHVKNDLWQLPAKYVGSYAESDALDPIAVYQKQKPLIEAEGLGQVLEMEHKLIPVIWKMRQRGVRVDLDRAEQVNKEWALKEKDLYTKLRTMIQGVSLDSVWSNEQVEAGALKLKLEYPKTQRGSASFKDLWLTQQKHDYWHTVSEIRGVNKLNDTFIRQSILENAVNGRVHCQFHPMRRDEGGTRSGRLSCSNPNLQQVPNPEHSPDAWKVRAIFVPEQGASWGKLDYSQQEPRIAVHYGCLQNFRGAHEAASEYNSNASADFYQILVKLSGVTRSEAKRLYLGRSYGMGKDKLARSLGVSVEEAIEIGLKMDGAVPFIKELYYDTMRAASNRGFIKTICGRRSHFNLWEPSAFNPGTYNTPLSLKEAQEKWPDVPLKRSGTHKSMNRLIQGSAADMTKRALINLYAEGILPMLQIHDEIAMSFEDIAEANKAKKIMEEALPIKVPMYAELKTGPSWGECK